MAVVEIEHQHIYSHVEAAEDLEDLEPVAKVTKLVKSHKKNATSGRRNLKRAASSSVAKAVAAAGGKQNLRSKTK